MNHPTASFRARLSGLANPALGRSGLANPALGRSGLANPALGRSGLAFACALLGLLLPASAQERPDYKTITFPAPPEFKAKSPERRQLANGIVVYVLEDHEFPTVSLALTVRTGSVYEPADKLGLAEITGELLRLGGTKTMKPEELDRRIEDMASSVETSIGPSSGSATAWTLVENLEATVAILKDVLRSPAFAQDKLDLIKGQLRTAIQARNDDASGVAQREMSRLMYGRDHPYGRVQELAHLDSITREDVIAFHQTWFVPGGMFFGVVGDITPDAAVALIEKHFGDWKGAQPNMTAIPEPTPSPAGVFYADMTGKKDVSQTVLLLGHSGVKRDNPDYPAIIMLNYVLGGGGFGTSRLLQEVRTKKGLAYSVWSSYRAPYERQGLFLAGCDTKAESTVAAVRAILGEIERIRTEEVGAEELADAQREIFNAEVFNYDSPGEILGRAITYEYYGYPADLLEKTMATLRTITAADVKAAAVKYLRPEEIVVFAAGDQGKFDAPLVDLGRGEAVTVDISIPVVEKRTETIDFEDATARADARSLAEKVVAALGGAETLKATRSMRVTVKVSASQGGQTMPPMDATLQVVAPDKVRMDITAFAMTMVASGETGWAKQGAGILDLPPSEVASLREEAERMASNPWLGVLDGTVEAAAGGAVDEEGTAVRLVGLKEGGKAVIYYVNPETGDVMRRVQVGDKGRTEMVNRDFQVLDGRRVAMSRRNFVNGDLQMTTQVVSIEHNPEIDPAVFEKPK